MIYCSGKALETAFISCTIRQNLAKKSKVIRQFSVRSRKTIDTIFFFSLMGGIHANVIVYIFAHLHAALRTENEKRSV